MLAGSDEFIKPDRMIRAYIEKIIGKHPNLDEAQNLIKHVHKELLIKFPTLKMRELDYLIWSYQRSK